MKADSAGSSSDRIAERLRSLPGVRDVDTSGLPDRLAVRCDASEAGDLASGALRALLEAELGSEVEVRVEVASRTGGSEGARARFEGLHLAVEEPGRVTARVTLEWKDGRHVGVSGAEASPAGELRAAAVATIDAIEKLIGDTPVFTLIGIKELYVFDHHLVAVLLYSPKLPDRRLIGTSIILQDRQTSAALAVLSATNRAVGTLTANDD